MSNALVVYDSPDAVRKDLAGLRSQLEEVLPARIDPDRFLRIVAKAVIENPKLMACTRLSLLSSIHTAAQLGLEPSGLLGSAYLVPYRRSHVVVDDKGRNVKHSVMEAQLIPGYRGLIDLARRSGEIVAIEADVVRARDHFDYEKGTNARLIHRPFIPNPSDPPEERDRGPFVLAYMIATLKGGHQQPEVMFYDEIEAVRRSSRAADDGPWVTHWSEMARKSVVRRGAKYLPLTTDFQRALELDEEAERNAEPPASSAPPSRAAQMLLDRTAARGTAPDGQMDPEPAPEPVPTQNGAPEPFYEPDPEAHQHAWRAPLPGMIEDGDYSEVCVGCGAKRPSQMIQDPMPPAPASASQICGDANPELGACTRAPDHPGGHKNAEGVWPRGRK